MGQAGTVVSELDTAIRHFRHLRSQREASTARALQDAFARASNGLQQQLDGMVAWLETNPDPPLWRVLAEHRTRNLLMQAESLFNQYSREVGDTIHREQAVAVAQAQSDARDLIEKGFGTPPVGVGTPFVALPQQAIGQLTATLQPGAPVRRLLDEFGGDAASIVESELITGVASGRSPRQTARAISDAIGGQYDRAFLITRTETLRAYRGAQQAIFEENKHLLEGWIWHASLSTRTCASCWAMHGTLHPVTESMSEHPAGRCSMIPRTKSWQDLGYDVPDTRPEIEPGVDVFNRLDPADQQKILSQKAYKAFRDGSIELKDLVHVHQSRTWGETRSVGSVEGALSRAAKRVEVIPAKTPPVDFTKRKDAEAFLQERGISFFNEVNIKKLGNAKKQEEIIASLANGLRDVEAATGRAVGIGEVSYGSVGNREYVAKLVPRAPDDPRRHLLTINTDSEFWKNGNRFGFVVEETPRDVFRHEVYHSVDADLVDVRLRPSGVLPESGFAYTDVITSHMTEPLTVDETFFASKVSSYAQANRAEFVAETFTGLTKKHIYNADVMAQYKRFSGIIPEGV